ncbi:MAG: MFS transporter, partial [Sphingomonadales bacterium]|nr:MFS transporter [Sphingomonadales bacterium]
YASVFLFILALFFNQVGVPMLWSMMADSVDYGQWKTGVRITGMNFSANLLALKLGVAAGGAATGWLLASYGYVANQEQTAEAMFGIALIFAVIPGVCGLIIAFVSRFYTLTDERTAQIQTEIGITGAASPRNA